MIKSILKLSLLGLLAVAVAGTPIALHAQGAPAAEKKPASRAVPFHGKLKAVDTTAKTISIGERTTETIQVTPDTRIMKGGKPATLADGTVGDEVAGAYHKDADGKLNAISIRFGPKPEPAAGAADTKKEEPKK
jgi:hypothetical protein